MTSPAPEPTHMYRRIRDGYTREFGFRKTRNKHIWDLVTPKGEVLGQWNSQSRLYYMKDGISGYVILKIDTPTNEETIREWRSIRPGK